jgi:putative ABC transport system permease protein
VGWWIARAGVAAALAAGPIDPTVAARVRLSLPVLLFSLLASAVTAVVAGIVPALESSRGALGDALKEGGRAAGGSARTRRLRQGLVVAEVALAAVLLVGASLLLRSFLRVSRTDPGFDTNGVLTGHLSLHGPRYDEESNVLTFFRESAARLRAIPGVSAAGAVSFLPFAGLGAATDFTVVGQPLPPAGQEPVTDVKVCDNGYFQAMRIPLRKGRLFEEREMRERSNVVVVSESFARTAFPGEEAIGRRVLIDMTRAGEDKPAATEIVGIVGDVKIETLTAPMRPSAYFPHPQLSYTAMTFVVRGSGEGTPLTAAMRAAVRSVDPDQPMGDVRAMNDWVGASLRRERFSSGLLAIFAATALLLAAVGIYGVMAYVVGQRRGEIGIRMALGATNDSIRKMVVAGGARLVLLGMAIGIPSALLLTGFLSSLLYETSRRDPAIIAAVMALLAAVALAASAVPAWRASRVRPVEALKGRT